MGDRQRCLLPKAEFVNDLADPVLPSLSVGHYEKRQLLTFDVGNSWITQKVGTAGIRGHKLYR